MTKQIWLAVLSAGLFIASCSEPAKDQNESVDMDQLRTVIQAKEDAYAAAEKAKDAAGVAAYYSDDAISYGKNVEPDKGKNAITAKIKDRMDKDTSNNYDVYKLVDQFAEGKMVVEIGSWTSFNPAGVEIDHGHYMSYFEKRDSSYLCVRDMNVTSTPVKPAP